MAKTMAQTLKGFRDFLPAEKTARDDLERKVVEVFERFGFQPLETPTLEYASLIMGKYGEEADRLVYVFEDRGGRSVALPYDQTVPSARVLSQYERELPRYFRRYAIRNVFRAERPQKGRYREFRQCDIDIFGSTSPLADAEILACTYFAFENVGYPDIRIKLNDRRTLVQTLEPYATPGLAVFSIIRSIDKLDKAGRDVVVGELVDKGLDKTAAVRALDTVERAEVSANLEQIMQAVRNLGVPDDVLVYSPLLARGLDYYTGAIFEVAVPEFPSGSLAGGGRFDELIADLGGPGTPAVGIAFGFDRMVETALALDLVPARARCADVLVAVFDDTTCEASLQAAATLRAKGVSCEVYPGRGKLGKQLQLADRKGIRLALVIGPDELARKEATLRDMKTGDQRSVALADIVTAARALL